MQRQYIKWVVLLALATVFFARFSPLTVVTAGHRGIVALFGKVDPAPLDEGLHLINPLASVIKIDVRVARSDSEGEAASLRAQKQEITPDLLKLREIEVQSKAIDKWNGVLPTMMAGGAVPFVGLASAAHP